MIGQSRGVQTLHGLDCTLLGLFISDRSGFWSGFELINIGWQNCVTQSVTRTFRTKKKWFFFDHILKMGKIKTKTNGDWLKLNFFVISDQQAQFRFLITYSDWLPDFALKNPNDQKWTGLLSSAMLWTINKPLYHKISSCFFWSTPSKIELFSWLPPTSKIPPPFLEFPYAVNPLWLLYFQDILCRSFSFDWRVYVLISMMLTFVAEGFKWKIVKLKIRFIEYIL